MCHNYRLSLALIKVVVQIEFFDILKFSNIPSYVYDAIMNYSML